jgi:hypothetical protein
MVALNKGCSHNPLSPTYCVYLADTQRWSSRSSNIKDVLVAHRPYHFNRVWASAGDVDCEQPSTPKATPLNNGATG